MKVKNILVIFCVVFFFFSMASSKKVIEKQDKYFIKNGIGYFINKYDNFFMKIYFDKNENGYIIEMKGKTEGWVAVGFGQTKYMKNAEIIIGYIKDGKTFLEHHFATGNFKHESFEKLGVDDKSLELIDGYEKNGYTVIKFERKLGLNNKYLKELKSGEKMKFMYAFGRTDNIRTIHKERGTMEIVLVQQQYQLTK